MSYNYFPITVSGPSAAFNGFQFQVSGDAQYRFIVGVTGKMFWGSGALATDVTLERTAAGVLTCSGLLVANTGLRVPNGAGGQLELNSAGGAALCGTLVLVGGTKTVNTTAALTASSLLVLTRKVAGGTIGTAITYTIADGVSFTVNSDNPLDTSTFTWLLIKAI